VSSVEDALRAAVPRVLGALTRRYGDFAACEDAVQDALLEASRTWPEAGLPDNPDGWLYRVASRRMVDRIRGDDARRRREELAAVREVPSEASGHDDTLTLLFLCCHPALTPASQVALTLRAVGGLTTGEIARAFLVPEATMGPRISRAKSKLVGARFTPPPEEEQPKRMRTVLRVLYLIFNEGYTASAGERLQRRDLAAEAIRLARMLLEDVPGDGEAAGLLALMLLTEARTAARESAEGALIPLEEQDRSRWDRGLIAEGTRLVEDAMLRSELGPYQLQAAIAALHVEVDDAADTDWAQIAVLYRILNRLDPAPVVTLNRAVAVGMSEGPQAGLDLLRRLEPTLERHHRFHAVRGFLLDRAGDREAARNAFRLAAQMTASLPEQRFLRRRAERSS
jgi:RNA polymerase sigma factor (sigma-70 family)